MTVRSYKDLEVWQKAMDLVVMCYQATKKFPKSEVYGLASQLQRAAVSIAANIAEGRERKHSKEFIQHLSIGYSSLAELETHIEIAQRLDYIDSTKTRQLLEKTAEIGRMLNGLRKSIKKRDAPDAGLPSRNEWSEIVGLSRGLQFIWLTFRSRQAELVTSGPPEGPAEQKAGKRRVNPL
jgi:four helix bundle protein